MKTTYRLLSVFIAMIIGQNCENNSFTPYDYKSIWSCHHISNWSVESLKEKVVGNWEWKYVWCCGESSNPYQNGTESEGLVIEFKNNGTGILVEHNTTSAFTWIINHYNNTYSFETTPSISQLNGQILFCDNVMMCNASYFDGADNFFSR